MTNDYQSLLSENLLKLLEEYVPDFFYIVDYEAGKYLHVSDSIKDCLGHNPKRFYLEDGVGFTLSLIHPNDLQPTLDTYTRYEKSEFVGKTHSAIMEYRLKDSKGRYVWVRSRDFIVEFTNDGKIRTTLGMVLLIDKAREKEEAMFRSLNIKEIAKETYAKYTKRRKELEKISYREFQIIELLAQGCSSKEIASKLVISEDTVETHRKNILKKLGLNNTVQTVNVVHKYRRFR